MTGKRKLTPKHYSEWQLVIECKSRLDVTTNSPRGLNGTVRMHRCAEESDGGVHSPFIHSFNHAILGIVRKGSREQVWIQ